MRILVLILFSLILMGGGDTTSFNACSCGGEPPPEPQCYSDQDCKRDLICKQDKCIDPATLCGDGGVHDAR